MIESPCGRSNFTVTPTAAPVQADEIVVKGQPMSGQVVKVTAKGLEVKTTYGKGNVLVPYDKIWCPGADEVTTLETTRPLRLGSLPRAAVVPLVIVALAIPVLGLAVEGGSEIESDPINWANQSSTSIENAKPSLQRSRRRGSASSALRPPMKPLAMDSI